MKQETTPAPVVQNNASAPEKENGVLNQNDAAAAAEATAEAAAAAEAAAPAPAEPEIVVLDIFADEAERAAEAAALAGREAEAERAAEVATTANEAATAARNTATAARDNADRAAMNAARSRYAAGRDTAADRATLAQSFAAAFALHIWEAAEKQRAALDDTDEAREAAAKLRAEKKKTSLSRALRNIGESIDLYNAILAPYKIQLSPETLTPAIVAAANITPFLLAPTADGARVALFARKKLHVVNEWDEDAVVKILKYNKVISDAAADAPRQAINGYLDASDKAAEATAEAAALAETLKARQQRADTLRRTLKNPRAREETKQRAAADLDTLNAEITIYGAKLDKAKRDAATAADRAAILRKVAAHAAGATEEAMKTIEKANDDYNAARAAFEAADRAADGALKRAHAAAAPKAKAAKVKIPSDAPAELVAAFAPDEAAAAVEARNAADAARAKLDEAAAALAAAAVAATTSNPAAKYGALVDNACKAMKAARDAKQRAAAARQEARAAKKKRDEAAPVDSGVSDAELLTLDAEKRAADEAAAEATAEANAAAAEAAAQLDALNVASEEARDAQHAAAAAA